MANESLIQKLEAKLEQIAKLGNEPHYGNSVGNTMALECLELLRLEQLADGQQPMPEPARALSLLRSVCVPLDNNLEIQPGCATHRCIQAFLDGDVQQSVDEEALGNLAVELIAAFTAHVSNGRTPLRTAICRILRPYLMDKTESRDTATSSPLQCDPASLRSAGDASTRKDEAAEAQPASPTSPVSSNEQPVESSFTLRQSDAVELLRCDANGHWSGPALEEIKAQILTTLPEREAGWVEIEDFRGEPNSTPLAWWWWEVEPDSRPELDEILLDEEGKMCGKGGCGAQYFSHVKLAGFQRPEPPVQRRRGSND